MLRYFKYKKRGRKLKCELRSNAIISFPEPLLHTTHYKHTNEDKCFSLSCTLALYFLNAEEYQEETMLYHSIIHIVKGSKTCSSFIIKLSQTKHVAHDHVIVSRTPSTNNPDLCSRQVSPNTHLVWWCVPTPAHTTPLPQVFSHNPKVVSLIHIPSNHMVMELLSLVGPPKVSCPAPCLKEVQQSI